MRPRTRCPSPVKSPRQTDGVRTARLTATLDRCRANLRSQPCRRKPKSTRHQPFHVAARPHTEGPALAQFAGDPGSSWRYRARQTQPRAFAYMPAAVLTMLELTQPTPATAVLFPGDGDPAGETMGEYQCRQAQGRTPALFAIVLSLASSSLTCPACRGRWLSTTAGFMKPLDPI
jgi:hypothetical protein